MSGSLVTLVARGAQDAFISGKPEVSFFKAAYKRHTNFSMFPVELQPIGTVGTNSSISLPIQRKGDLLSYVWADCGGSRVDDVFNIKHANPSVFRLYVGGQLIEEHDAYFASKLYPKFLANTGAKTTAFRNAASGSTQDLDSTYLPLHFSFCDEYGLSLPLVSLQYHDVEIRVNFNAGNGAADLKWYANYIQLDTEERQMLANEPREMLITQVQRIQKDTDTKVDLSYFNHPVKCILWGSYDTVNANTPFSFTNLKFTLNGVDMFDPMPAKYFSHVQTYHHTTNGSDLQAGNDGDAQNLYMHSFALKADKHQPCGTVNFSRLDNGEMKFGTTTQPSKLAWVYGVNYNILRIQNGMAGIAFAN